MNTKFFRRVLTAVALPLVLLPGQLFAWSPKQAPIMTRWAKDVDPEKTLPDYPRPQMVRADWLNLNGVWEYQPGKEGDALPAGQKLSGEILVPFPVESALSGVMEHHDRLWYRRQFTVPADWKGKRTLLHFGAVDFESEVFVNGQSAGVHKGGYLPFSYDVTPLLKGDGPQELIVRVFDPTDDAGEPRGKQTLHPGGIMYTPTTGIWQTVWLEPVDQQYIESLKIVPDVNAGVLKLTVNVNGMTTNAASVTVKVIDSEMLKAGTDGNADALLHSVVGSAVYSNANTELSIPVPNAKLWTPDHPFLYALEVTLNNGREIVDSVKSYAGMRKISVGEDNGIKKMLLNNQFVFEFGPLDQGFWPDGIYTAPTEAAMKNDIEMMKAFGFNMVRKHIKVEPARWYYWCDKLGLLVWQDMPSGNSYIDTKKYKTPPLDTAQFDSELAEMVKALWNVPSIIMWEPFNEGQSQHDTPKLVEMIKALDPSRLVNEASGGAYTSHGDVFDLHQYPAPGCPKPSKTQALALGEFGGVAYNMPDHTWTGKGSGYINASDPAILEERYNEYAAMLRGFRDQQGLSAAVYTQLTDVETEINGLLTYDRVPKVDPAKLVAANHLEYLPPDYRAVLPTSEDAAQTWKYTTGQPAAGWEKTAFDDAAWTDGAAPFGKQEGVVGRTPWATPDIWLRKHFNPGPLSADELQRLALRIFHDDDVQVFINGVPAFANTGYVNSYEYRSLSKAATKALVSGGDNVLAIHCLQKTGGQYIDAGLSERELPKK